MDLKKADLPLTVTGDGEQTRDFIDIKDVVSANLKAMKSIKVGKGEIINIGSTYRASVNEIAELVGGPIEYLEPRVEPRDTQADITKAKALLDWEPKVMLEEGISELKSVLV